jgi:hypothetical protein
MLLFSFLANPLNYKSNHGKQRILLEESNRMLVAGVALHFLIVLFWVAPSHLLYVLIALEL